MQGLNKLEFIKKTRPKINIGDYFVFKINNRFYTGLVIHNQWMKDCDNNTMFTLLVSNYFENKIEDVAPEKLLTTLEEEELLIPPININKKGWLNGFFITIGNLGAANISQNLLDKCRFFYGLSTIYNLNYEEINNINSSYFIGRSGIYNDRGFEFLVQISLDLEFSDDENDYDPYDYYEELKGKYPNLELPFWYHKAKQRLKQ